MLRIIKRLFSSKRRSPIDSAKTKKKSPKTNKTRKSILKRSSMDASSASMNAPLKKKSLVFSPEIHSIKEFSDSEFSDSEKEKVRACYPPQRPRIFPCRNKYTVFDNIDEFNVYAREVSDKIIKQRQRGLPTVKEHYKTMKTQLKEKGHYRKKIPPQYRLYDEDSGNIIDLRLFPDEDDDDDNK